MQPSIIDIEKGRVENDDPPSGKQQQQFNISSTSSSPVAATDESPNASSSRSTSERVGLVFLYVIQFVGFGASIAGIVLVWYYMGWEFGLPAVLIALLAVLIASGKWHWFYIAAVTAPRDVK